MCSTEGGLCSVSWGSHGQIQLQCSGQGSKVHSGHCCATLQLQAKGKALMRRPLPNAFLARFRSQRWHLLVWHPPRPDPCLHPLLMQVLPAEQKLQTKFVREVLSLSHEVPKEPLCFLNSSSERNLGTDGSSLCPRLYV